MNALGLDICTGGRCDTSMWSDDAVVRCVLGWCS